MKVLVLLSHPRQDSLCGQVCDYLAEALAQQGHIVEVADLHREGFDPVMRSEDEPNWGQPAKTCQRTQPA